MRPGRSLFVDRRISGLNRSLSWSATAMIRVLLAVVLALFLPRLEAIGSAALTVNSISAQGWTLQGVSIALTDLAQRQQKLALTVDQLTLPKPFNDISLLKLHCTAFTWQHQQMSCDQGRAELRSTYWHSPSTQFSIQIDQKRSRFKLAQLSLAGAKLAVEGYVEGDSWQLQVNGRGIDLAQLASLFPKQPVAISAGKVDLRLNISGTRELVNKVAVKAHFYDLSGQTADGKIATEGLKLNTDLDANFQNGFWQAQNNTEIEGGALYLEPFYLDAKDQSIHLDSETSWDITNGLLEIRKASILHDNLATLSGNASVRFKNEIRLEQADLSLQSNNLAQLSSIYLKPLLAQTTWEGLALNGKASAEIVINQQSLQTVAAFLDDVGINDAAGRVQMKGGTGTLNWANDGLFNKPSTLAWKQLQVYVLPIGPARLAFSTQANNFSLLNKPSLPFLGGTIAINEFSWQAKPQQEPKVVFTGSLAQVSLEQLSKAMNWTPLSGTISGDIPRVEYSNKTLALGGELLIKVFDGVVKVSNVASSELFSALPKFHVDLEIDNLDMEQLTGKFEFGGITGKLSGFVQKLYLENWQPVSFYAWLGTPDDDDSRHRISQKAVKNIANIGGGGAADALSRSFLSFFETFGYDKLGLGCYLKDGVCQMMGVKAAPSGYAIITGGGLPRIEVIGYNPRVDWAVLMERLKRITTSDEVIIN